MTGTPRSSESAEASTETPLAIASSVIFRSRTTGSSISANWIVSRSPLLRFLESITCMTDFGFCLSRRSLVTRSSSEEGSRLFTPGVSMIVSLVPLVLIVPLEISTVVPGKFDTVTYLPDRYPNTTLFPTFGFPIKTTGGDFETTLDDVCSCTANPTFSDICRITRTRSDCAWWAGIRILCRSCSAPLPTICC